MSRRWLKGDGIHMRLSQSISKEVLTNLCRSRIYWISEAHELPHWSMREYWDMMPGGIILAASKWPRPFPRSGLVHV